MKWLCDLAVADYSKHLLDLPPQPLDPLPSPPGGKGTPPPTPSQQGISSWPHLPGIANQRPNQRRRDSGFTLVEMLVTLIITVELILVGLALFDFQNRLTHVQFQVSEMQQAERVSLYELTRMTRMAGRGGWPFWNALAATPAPGALDVRDNVTLSGASNQVAINYPNTPLAVDGTDILKIRGVINSPIFQVNAQAAGSFAFVSANGTPAKATAGTVDVCDYSNTGIPQDLTALINAVGSGVTEALLMVIPASDTAFAVVELNPGASNTFGLANPYAFPAQPPPYAAPQGPATCTNFGFNGVRLAFNVTGGSNAAQYQKLSATTNAGLPTLMTSVLWLGIVEEYRYYVRQDYAIPTDPNSDAMPHLSRARMFPGTELPYNNDVAQLSFDVADNVLDLQVAIGVDSNANGIIDPEVGKAANDDEWVFNFAGDCLYDSKTGIPCAPGLGNLFYARVSVLARTGRRDPDEQYQAPLLTRIENHTYKVSDPNNTVQSRMYRRRLLQTIVAMHDV